MGGHGIATSEDLDARDTESVSGLELPTDAPMSSWAGAEADWQLGHLAANWS